MEPKRLDNEANRQPQGGAALSQQAVHSDAISLPTGGYSLSGRLLGLILVFVTLGGMVIHLPSIVSYRTDYLEHAIIDAYMATLALQINPDYPMDGDAERKLLAHSRALGIEVRQQNRAPLTLGRLSGAEARFDLRTQTVADAIRETLLSFFAGGKRLIQVTGAVPHDSGVVVSVLLNEQPLFAALADHSIEALTISALISLITAVLVYLALQRFMVHPIIAITKNLVAFREGPDESERVIKPSGRGDEIGVMEQELARMQTQLRFALAQQDRLAALGKAVSKINHDFKSILSTISIASERLAKANDLTVKKISALLTDSAERGMQLCIQTQDLARGDQAVLHRPRFPLRPLLNEIGEALKMDSGVRWDNQVEPELNVEADRERLYRALLNLGRNAAEAQSQGGEVRITATRIQANVVIDIADKGPGIPQTIVERLFQPFISSGRPGGTGLGLATARDLVRAHGGDLVLLSTGPEGTQFQIHVHLRTDGWIEDLIVKYTGKRVRKGGLLFSLYSPTLVNAQTEYLLARKGGQPALIISAEDNLRALGITDPQIKALAKRGQTDQLIQIRATQDGIVSELHVAEGMYIKPATTVATIADLSSVWLLADVFEDQSQWVKEGFPATMRLPYIPGKTWEGLVDYVYPTIDPKTRTLKVRLRFNNPGEQLKPNMYTEVTLYGEAHKNALTIPREALIRTGVSERVILDQGEGRFRPVAVTAGIESGKWVEILSGLTEGDKVVVSGQFLIDSESSLSASFQRLYKPSARQDSEDVAITGQGVIEIVMLKDQKLNMTHEPIPALGWPAMTMDFKLLDISQAEKLRKGDRVRFELTQGSDGAYAITRISAIEK